MSNVTIVIPISRAEHLEKLFHSLEVLECDRKKTSLFVYVDGNTTLFEQVRVYVDQTKFADRKCIHRLQEGTSQTIPGLIPTRRRRISAIHNEIKGQLQQCDYVFLIEDDTIVPSTALKKLLNSYAIYPYAGFLSGVELGRWGITHVGAWKADSVYEPTRIESLEPKSGLAEVDAAGMYCLLTKYENYVKHEFKPFDGNSLGPDVDWSLSLRQQGFKNYVDWNLKCRHLLKSGEALTISGSEVIQVAMVKKDNGTWRQELMRG